MDPCCDLVALLGHHGASRMGRSAGKMDGACHSRLAGAVIRVCYASVPSRVSLLRDDVQCCMCVTDDQVSLGQRRYTAELDVKF